jgi:pimeloyl-ACP methyl ester carboxylesterase
VTPRPGPRPVVLVHGAWHGAWCWATLQAELDRRGVPSFAVDLPGHGVSTEPPGDLAAHVDHVTAVVERMAPAEVVLVGHSYGGAVVSGAAPRVANVASVVYVAAYALLPDESVRSVVQHVGAPPALIGKAMQIRDDGTVAVDPDLATDALYACCPPRVAAAAVARLSPQALVTFRQTVQASPIGSVPTTYVRCLRDQAAPLEEQDLMAARCDETVTLDTDHSPFLSAVSELADVLERRARE